MSHFVYEVYEVGHRKFTKWDIVRFQARRAENNVYDVPLRKFCSGTSIDSIDLKRVELKIFD